MEAQVDRLQSDIPASWQGTHDTFATLTKAEDKARKTYRRQADNSFEQATAVLAVLDANKDFAALEDELRSLRANVVANEPAETHESVNDLARKFSKLDGAKDVKSALSKARSALKSKSPDKDKALTAFDKAITEFEAQLVWRAAADADLRTGLLAFTGAIVGTLGARQQGKLTRDQALYLASCSSGHRDISLNF